MFKTYSSLSSLVITSRWFATSRLAVPASVRLVYCIHISRIVVQLLIHWDPHKNHCPWPIFMFTKWKLMSWVSLLFMTSLYLWCQAGRLTVLVDKHSYGDATHIESVEEVLDLVLEVHVVLGIRLLHLNHTLEINQIWKGCNNICGSQHIFSIFKLDTSYWENTAFQ